MVKLMNIINLKKIFIFLLIKNPKIMMSSHFEKWLIKNENKANQTAYSYSKAIYRISKHYSEQLKQEIDLYTITDIQKLKTIADLYGKMGKYSKVGDYGNGTNRAAINSLCRFRENTRNFNFSMEESSEIETLIESEIETENYITNFSYEKDLKNSMIYQISELFPDYRIYGEENEGVEYLINGKRIDILLEKSDKSLLIIELKSGLADFKVFGQISMYLGLLMEKFPDKVIRGCIIAGEIDKTLKSATKTSSLISLMTYTMKLELTEE